ADRWGSEAPVAESPARPVLPELSPAFAEPCRAAVQRRRCRWGSPYADLLTGGISKPGIISERCVTAEPPWLSITLNKTLQDGCRFFGRVSGRFLADRTRR